MPVPYFRQRDARIKPAVTTVADSMLRTGTTLPPTGTTLHEQLPVVTQRHRLTVYYYSFLLYISNTLDIGIYC